eukprot:XP_001702370.1 predicted protein [Chlamydomonas reinhardtii]
MCSSSLARLSSGRATSSRRALRVPGHVCLLWSTAGARGPGVGSRSTSGAACIHHSALDAAVAVGDVSACEALLGAGAGWDGYAAELAAEGGHLPVLQLLQRRGMPLSMLCDAACVLRAACRGGHAHVVEWLETRKGAGFMTAEEMQSADGGSRSELAQQLAHRGRLSEEASRLSCMAAAAAKHGHTELFESIVTRLEQASKPATWAAQLLAAVAAGCSLELLQHCYSRWVGEGPGQLSLPDSPPAEEAPRLTDAKRKLLGRAGGSATPDALAKFDWLLEQWPSMRASLLQQERPPPNGIGWGVWRPLQRSEGDGWTRRLRELSARGCGFSMRDATYAVKADDVEAVSYLLPYITDTDMLSYMRFQAANCSHLAVLQLLQKRQKFCSKLVQQVLFHAADENTGIRAAADALICWWCEEADDETSGLRPQHWRVAFSNTASSGVAGLQTLQALHRRGGSEASCDLKELATGGCEEQMEWGAALLAEAGQPLPTFSAQEVWDIAAKHGNYAGLDWLRARGLIPHLPSPQWVAGQHMCAEGFFNGLSYWLRATAADLERIARLLEGPAEAQPRVHRQGNMKQELLKGHSTGTGRAAVAVRSGGVKKGAGARGGGGGKIGSFKSRGMGAAGKK